MDMILSLIFIKVQELQIILKITQTYVLIFFFQEKVLSDIRSEIHRV